MGVDEERQPEGVLAREVKQVIVINRGLSRSMPRGKEIAQGSHAAMAWLSERLEFLTGPSGMGVAQFSDAERAWLTGAFTKAVVQAPGTPELQQLHEDAIAAGLEAHLITDAGRTVFHGEPTITALAIGPDYAEKIDKITGHLKLY